ncbi:MAG: oligosaccharide flippase family protein [Limisphaerales bacterium]
MLANYVSQIYVSLLNIVMVPLYIRYMGAEAYGLVGFFSMLQAWFQLVDVGLTPTMARETARFNGGAIDVLTIRRLLRALEIVFVTIAIVGAAAVFFGADGISSKWIKAQQLPLDAVREALMLMGAIVALRWVSGLYRGALTGLEHLTLLSVFNIFIATARFVLVILVFRWVGSTPSEFFAYQLGVALVELICLLIWTYRFLPKADSKPTKIALDLRPIRDVLKFSLSLAFTSTAWILVTQTDKLLLSKLLPLREYAYFTLAVLVANGVNLVSSPISAAILPRLTRLAAENDEAGMVALYRNATQLVGVLSISTSLVLAFFSYEVLRIWTGSPEIARQAAPILSLYAIGNGILAIAAFPYYLQFAKGDMRLHLIGNGLFVAVLVPGLIFATLRFGSVGAGYAWVFANALYVVLWVPKVHARFVKGLHRKWVSVDVAAVAVMASVACFLVSRLKLTWPHDRGVGVLLLMAIGAGTLIATAIGSAFVRSEIAGHLMTWVTRDVSNPLQK